MIKLIITRHSLHVQQTKDKSLRILFGTRSGFSLFEGIFFNIIIFTTWSKKEDAEDKALFGFLYFTQHCPIKNCKCTKIVLDLFYKNRINYRKKS